MKIFGLLLLVGIFAVMPMVLLNAMVMPEIENLQHTYSNLDKVAAKAVEQ